GGALAPLRGRTGDGDAPPLRGRHHPRLAAAAGSASMTGPETVLVAGPPRAGVSGVVAELRRRMPSHRFVEAGETGAPRRPAVVVFVVSAVAPITRSDCVLADRVAASTDAVVAVLAKIDDHRDWTAVLEANRECLAGHAGRFGRVPWV